MPGIGPLAHVVVPLPPETHWAVPELAEQVFPEAPQSSFIQDPHVEVEQLLELVHCLSVLCWTTLLESHQGDPIYWSPPHCESEEQELIVPDTDFVAVCPFVSVAVTVIV